MGSCKLHMIFGFTSSFLGPCVFYFRLYPLWQNAQETQERAMSKQVFNVSARILFSVIFIDTATACPAQVGELQSYHSRV